MIYAIAIWISAFIIKLAFDRHLYLSRKSNHHLLGPVLVIAVLIVCSRLAGWLSAPMWFFCWWALYDPSFAKLIGEKLFYVGETSWLDKLQRRFKVVIFLKYLLAISSIIFFICNIHRQI